VKFRDATVIISFHMQTPFIVIGREIGIELHQRGDTWIPCLRHQVLVIIVCRLDTHTHSLSTDLDGTVPNSSSELWYGKQVLMLLDKLCIHKLADLND